MKNPKIKRNKPKLRKKPYRVTIISGLSVAIVFSVLSLIANFGDWVQLGLNAGLGLFLGLFLGLLAAPEFEPKHFKFPVLWQTVCGGIGGLFVALI